MSVATRSDASTRDPLPLASAILLIYMCACACACMQAREIVFPLVSAILLPLSSGIITMLIGLAVPICCCCQPKSAKATTPYRITVFIFGLLHLFVQCGYIVRMLPPHAHVPCDKGHGYQVRGRGVGGRDSRVAPQEPTLRLTRVRAPFDADWPSTAHAGNAHTSP